ncbi:putative Vacuolar-processing enzyme [Monocercomonoides exilis]|uniref:putative Vacuolar-processing enzyme n=1 Tax=Monocercomonoides exilis TaxID=2049356 RepID=UPI00355A02EA|nr:putative Vacuolar-processing enzyme [Monocercomonoides exilis]|eukprot:MONOS_1513.1-p1 / transcript=MONOS_1513.1 / gene=MONOS_1513 / organism=Monocercomonoides_exilis_PA203 / gene_product=Vacuolar-processing enzyme / transcript_product=Vacuolar-processing enzyme / location=Mono_scaffold00027:25147-26860(+) / protein_length=468 / sequence_SO=supercontig / SO=protein_coding / is_pseudo=false
MAYDDVVTASENKFPGMMFNAPDGQNNYPGAEKIDYRGRDCTAKNFLAALSGDEETASGPVLHSTSVDNIFLFYSDHGTPGILTFPSGSYLHAKDFIDTIVNMSKLNKFKKMLIYIEACYSGSMFEDLLPSNIGVFAMTAANGEENSWATYCGVPSFETTCLGDELACAWMEHTESVDIHTTHVKEQTNLVKESVTKSHVCFFGDERVLDDMLSDYQHALSGLIPDSFLHFIIKEKEKKYTSASSHSNTSPAHSTSSNPLTQDNSQVIRKQSGVKTPPLHADHSFSLHSQYFESTPQGMSHYTLLRRAAQQSNDPSVKASLQKEEEAMELASNRTSLLLSFFEQQLKKKLNANTSNTTNVFNVKCFLGGNNTNGEANSEVLKLVEHSERANDVEKYKMLLDLYTASCGPPDDYSLIPHFKIMANAVNAKLVEEEEDVVSFGMFLNSRMCNNRKRNEEKFAENVHEKSG